MEPASLVSFWSCILDSQADRTALLELPPPQFKLVNDSILWAVKHTMRDIADLGLSSEYPHKGTEKKLTGSRVRSGQQLRWISTRDCQPVLPAIHGQPPR